MLIRVFLILAILAGVGTVAVTQFMVRPHVQSIIQERDTNKENWDKETRRANKLNKDLNETQTKLTATEGERDQAKVELAQMTVKANDQERRANGLQQNLDTTKAELTDAQRKLAAWNALGIPVEGVAQLIESEKRFRERTDVLQQELAIVIRQNTQLTNIIWQLRGGDEQLVEMPGVKGNILAVDPKWQFVVLDVGEKGGAKPKGVFMVSRQGKLIGKVKVTTVEPERSIANIMPGWQLEEIMEGDQVIF